MKINTNNRQKIEAAINSAQGTRCTARLITYGDVLRAVEAVEQRLIELGIPKVEWAGLRVACDPNAQDFPRAYKYTPEATLFVLMRGAAAWFVVSIDRSHCEPLGHDYTIINLMDKREAILRHAGRAFS